MMQKNAVSAMMAIVITGLVACGSDNDDPVTPPESPPPAAPVVGNVVAVTTSGKLVSFDRATPGTLATSVQMSGLAAGETVLGIDTRPADGLVYAVGSSGRIFTIEPATGVLTPKSTLGPAAGDDNPFSALPADASYGVDFNPVADRLRLVASNGLNLRINVDTGAAITDGVINGGPAGTAVTASAYTDSFAGTVTTRLYGIDAQAGSLFLQDPPNNGTLAAPVALGITATAANGFDIDARANTAYAALTNGAATTFYRVPLTADAAPATAAGVIGGGEAVTAIALVQPANPVAFGLTADNRIVSFDPVAPGTLAATAAITGVGAGETVVGIDFRPADGRLYALTGAAKIYTVDPESGAATPLSALTPAATDTTAPYAGLVGTIFSVDFNPVADRMRVISDTGQNLRIDVQTGATITDGDINRAAAATVVAGAYTNSFAGTIATTLFDLDAAADVLATQTPPNDGTLVEIGALGIDLTGATAFDIAGGGNGLALAAVPSGPAGPSTLYGVSLATGAMTLYRNMTGSPAASQVGGVGGPLLIDLAMRL